MTTYGLVYRLRDLPADGNGRPEAFEVTFTYAASSADKGEFRIRWPSTWMFEAPLIDGPSYEPPSASGTAGLFGGVEVPQQQRRSEACERAIGDVLTVLLKEVLIDNLGSDRCVAVLGPAFPKVVGRFASLHPPEETKILFLQPLPFPAWVVGTASEHVFTQPRDNAIITNGKLSADWDDETLVVTCRYDHEGRPYRLQALRLDLSAALTVPAFDWFPGEFLETGLPFEMPFAAEQVQAHEDTPYSHNVHDMDLPELRKPTAEKLRTGAGLLVRHANITDKVWTLDRPALMQSLLADHAQPR